MSVKSDETIADKTTRLNGLVSWFDSDEFELELALVKFEEAEKLATEIENDLLGLKNKIDVLKVRFDEE